MTEDLGYVKERRWVQMKKGDKTMRVKISQRMKGLGDYGQI
jgi:hypothetical protein